MKSTFKHLAAIAAASIKGTVERQGREGNMMRSEWIAPRAK